jgi:hypothetical protein
MYEILTVIHSFLRWAVLLLLLATIIKSLNGLITKRSFSNSDNKISLFMMISAHTQLLVGLLLYFVSPNVQFGNMKDDGIRFFTMEHSSMMIIAIVFMTLARILSKKATIDNAKFKKLFIFSTIALLIILVAIPWPFYPAAFSRPWFSPN